MKYQVCWNNVCLLSKVEKQWIQKVTLENQLNTLFEFSYFGLGQGSSLYNEIKKRATHKEAFPDIIVSTDLEVFQNVLFKEKFTDSYQLLNPNPYAHAYLSGHANLTPESLLFKPFIVIPLIMIVNESLLKGRECPKSIADLIHGDFRDDIVFGGIDNSAGYALMKSIWWKYGEGALNTFLDYASAKSMPAQAFQSVLKGEKCVGFVPSIFALRQGTRSLKAIWPEEGAVGIPSYVAVSKKVTPEDYQKFESNYLNLDFQQQLVTIGDIFPEDSRVPLSRHLNKMMPALADLEYPQLLYPDWSFTETLDYAKFKAMIERVRGK